MSDICDEDLKFVSVINFKIVFSLKEINFFNKVFVFGNKNGFNSWIIFWVVCKCKLLIK